MITAKRLQDLSRIYGVSILVCEDTRQIIKDTFHTREVDLVYVQGRVKPVVIFEVMGRADKDLAHDMMTVSCTLVMYNLIDTHLL